MRLFWIYVPVALFIVILLGRGFVSTPADADVTTVAPAWEVADGGLDGRLEGGIEGDVRAPSGYWLKEVVSAKVTGYEPSALSCGKHADGRTSIGRDANEPDGVAVNPEAIPYGALVFIPGIGFRQVDDTGGAMRQAWRKRRQVHIDVRFRSVKEALNWGVRQDVPVHVFIKN